MPVELSGASVAPVRHGLTHRVLVVCAIAVAVAGALFMGACAGRPGSTAEEGDRTADVSVSACCGDSAMGVALRIASDYRDGALASRVFSDEAFWTAALPMAQYAGFDVLTLATTPARLRGITIGQGPDTVLVWSQATAGASTGTMALADVLRWFANTRAEDRDDALRARLLSGLTLLVVPLVPEGFASGMAVPDALVSALRATGSLRAPSWRPLVSVGLVEAVRVDVNTDSLAATLATSGTERARLVGATLALSLRTELPGRLARARPLASATTHDAVLLASGALPNDPQQQRLRAVHAAALLTLFDGLATGAYRHADSALLNRLPLTPSR